MLLSFHFQFLLTRLYRDLGELWVWIAPGLEWELYILKLYRRHITNQLLPGNEVSFANNDDNLSSTSSLKLFLTSSSTSTGSSSFFSTSSSGLDSFAGSGEGVGTTAFAVGFFRYLSLGRLGGASVLSFLFLIDGIVKLL